MANAIHGAAPYNDDFEVGFDARFERSWHRAEIIGRAGMVVVIAAALLGFLGRGPFSHQRVESADKHLSVDYEPVARYNTTTEVTLHIDTPPDANTVAITLPTKFAEPFGLSRIVPQPIRQSTEAGGITITVATVPDQRDQMIRLVLQPSAVGPVPLWIEAGGRRLDWTQVVLP